MLQIPDEILEVMTEEAIKEAFKIPPTIKLGNRITKTCKTREEALILGKWKGLQNKGTYTQKPLPKCFTNMKKEDFTKILIAIN